MHDWANHPEYLALLRTVLENPWDDAPRLVISDWLEEHDQQNRAEFIRFQIELANHYRESANIPNENEFAQRRFWLHQQALARFPTSDDTDSTAKTRQYPITCDWDRGFIHCIKLTKSTFLQVADDWFARHPITSVNLSDITPTQEGLNRYSWNPDDEWEGFNNLPKALYRLLECERFTVPKDPSQGVYYYSEDEAQMDLSHACVAYGRRLAKLPMLRPTNKNLIYQL